MNGMTFALMGLGGRCNIKGGILILAGISLIVSLSHILKENRILSYIGRNSIVFYFLSGGGTCFLGQCSTTFFPGENVYCYNCSSNVIFVIGMGCHGGYQ